MPVTTRFSAALDKTYDDTNQSSPPAVPLTAQAINAASVSSGGTAHSSPNGSISSYSRTNSVDSLDDSHSSSSGGYSGHCRQLSNDSSINSGSDYIPTRSIKQASKAVRNPLQFVKTGTCELYKKAEEQIKKAEEVKKLKTVARQDEEEWQHNLDNWKSKRRQISHKTIERTEEWKRMEEEESERAARTKKNKTFSEMMEERSKRGRKLSYFADDWDNENFDKKSNGCNGSSNDEKLDSGLTSPSSHKFTDDESDASSIGKSRFESPEESSPQLKSSPVASNNSVTTNGKRISTNGKSEPKLGSENGATPPTEEYTFDKAIQEYVQYAENHQRKMAKSSNNGVVKSRSDFSSFESRYLDDDVDNGASSPVVDEPEPVIQRSGGTAMTIVVTLVKSGIDQRDFGFSTRGQGRGLVFVDSVNAFGPAENAGLRSDDEILAVNGESVSNRSHSAIVFAIKQAVYTGCLELYIYRYDNTELAVNLTQSPQSCVTSMKKKPSRVEERKAVFSGEQNLESPTNHEKKLFTRENSPRVDIRKRRSLFETVAEQSTDPQPIQKQESWGLKNRIASFDNPSPVDPPKQNVIVETEGSFKDKLKSFEKIVSEDRKPERRTSADRCEHFKSRLASFERDEPTEKQIETKPMERKQSLKDKVALFEKQESFERSQSCDLLDVGRDESYDSPKKTKNDNNLDWIDIAEENGGRPRIINAIAKDPSPEPVFPDEEELLVDLSEPPVEEVIKKKTVSTLDVSWENRFLALERKMLSTDTLFTNTSGDGALDHNSVEELGFNLDCGTPCSTHLKSGFELAESLQETPIIASNPSSPCSQKKNCVNLDVNVKSDDMDENQVLPNEIHSENGELNLEIESMAQELNSFEFDDIVDAPIRLLEPPKEKPPPPPETTSDISPDATGVNIRPAESSKRIRKEMLQRRSDFLGIDPADNQNYLDVELQKPAPPDMEAILRAEKTFDEQLRKNSVNESNSSRLVKNDVEEPVKLINNSTKASDDDDIARKEQEIIENLEREEERKRNEIIAYFGDDPQDRLEEERLMSELDLLQEEKLRREEMIKLHERERRLQQHEPVSRVPDKKEMLRLEKEKLRRQQEAFVKEKDEYKRQVQQFEQKFSPAVRRKNLPPQPISGNHHDKAISPSAAPILRNSKGDVKPTKTVISSKTCLSNPESREREDVLSKSNNFPSGDSHLKHDPTKNPIQHQPMTKQTLHAISALPKAKITDGDRWIARRKPEAARRDPSMYNQHWLIQEAEMRRISEQQNRQAKSPTRYQQRLPPPQPQFYESVQYNARPGGPVKSSEDIATRGGPDRKDYSDVQSSATLKNYSAHSPTGDSQMLSVSGKKKCSHCAKELGRGAAMIIESLQLFYHIHCFKCCVCHVQLGNGLSGADVRVRNQKLHCHNCYSNDEGLKFSKV